MSSILKALKKLEAEKSQRDELSTIVASDILRSSRGRKRHVAQQVAVAVVVVSMCAVGGYLFAIHTEDTRSSESANVQSEMSQQSAGTRSAVADLSTRSAPGPSSTGKVAPRDLPRLSGIIFQPAPQDRMAIINDLPVMEGTLVADFEITSIQPDRVILRRAGSEFVLYLAQ